MRRSWMALALLLGACGSHEGPAAPSRSLLPLTVGGVTLVAADPQPGSVLPLQSCGRDDCLEIVFTFQRTAVTRESLSVHVELKAEDGTSCTPLEGGWREVEFPPGTPTTFQVRALARFDPFGELAHTCTFPPPVPGQPARMRIVAADLQFGRGAPLTFDVPYEVTTPGLSASPTAPTVEGMTWQWTGIGDDNFEPHCIVRDDDGEPLAVDISFETPDCLARGRCWQTHDDIPARAFAIDVAAGYGSFWVDPGQRRHGELICQVRDAGGRKARRSFPVCIDGPGTGQCPGAAP